MIQAVSLFSGVGIGEFYLKECGIDIVLANEIVPSRAIAHSFFYPACEMINGDITQDSIKKLIIDKGKKYKIDLVIATPPCQGFSSAGKNKTEQALYKDSRNILILSALDVVDELRPDYLIIENVPRFRQMMFQTQKKPVSLYDLLLQKYSSDYEVRCDVLNAADYGIPQMRYRVIYRMWKKGLKWDLPPKSKQITLQDAIGDLPALEPGETSAIKNHYARKHPHNQVECMRHTPTGKSAFTNVYYYPKKLDGTRIMGYGNSYKRMRWDAPAPTITMRNEIISSQENVHPGRPLGNGQWSDARVLTLRELLIVSSLPADLDIPGNLTETAFRQLIGEGIPPLLMKKVMEGIYE